ncbi:MAG: PASTA domain-containing protein [Clostridiales bacterium]|jgi:stage V sporulation protein D (sporulation-specific penicillin-binding protein)|nr:PASTA domain-containing protein [Clostridiales bacterium]
MDVAGKKTNKLKPNRQIIRRTLFLMIVCGILSFVVLLFQLYKIQILEHSKWESEAIEQQVRETVINASRGTIYDTNMKILAMSATVDTVFISPIEMLKYEEDPSLIASGLSEILGVSYESIMEKWEDTKSWYKTVAVKIEQEVSDKVREFKNEHKLKSVHIVEDTKRYYPYSSLASQVIGFVGIDNKGLEGVEAVYEKYLRGLNGRIVRATSSEGTDMLFNKYEDYFDAVEGNALVLTLDTTIQYYLEKHIEQAINDYMVQNGAVGIVMDVNTGAVLAMCTLPDYDLNNYLELNDAAKVELEEQGLEGDAYNAALTEALQNQWRNRSISDTYEPGSTFKIITLASCLEEGVVNPDTDFYCKGSIDVKGRKGPLHCWRHAGHGSQNLVSATQHSCNVAFTTMGLMLGADKFYEYVRSFGFMDSTGIDLNGEGKSIWWPDSQFKNPDNLSSLAVASFGQTFNITPLQLISAVSAVANGGYLMEPYVVKQIVSPEGEILLSREPRVIRQVISEETSARVCEILESVVGSKEGTGKNAYVEGYRIAGKTGTSEDVGQMTDEYIVSFVGFAPADDPKIAVLVLLDNPSPDSGIPISGGFMAAPVVGNIFSDVLPYMGVEPVYSEDNSKKADITLPGVKNMSVEEAKEKLKALGFKVQIEGGGDTVIDQIPIANVNVAAGSTIILYTETGRPTNLVTVPDLFDMSYSKARETLEQAGLYIRSSGVIPSGSNTIVVARQSIEKGNEVSIGSVIEVTLIDRDQSIIETA